MGTRVLVVDDDTRIRRTLRTLLESTDEWEVCGEAVNGTDAVAKVKDLNPQLILMDFAMPDLNGLLAAKAIAEFLPKVPVVLHTMHDGPTLRAEAERFGVQFVVAKGSTRAAMIETMRLALASVAEEPPSIGEDTRRGETNPPMQNPEGDPPPLPLAPVLE